VNCHGTISYIYNKNNTETTEETDNTSYTVHLDGGQRYTFTIWSRNSHGQSTPVVRDWSADELGEYILPVCKVTQWQIFDSYCCCLEEWLFILMLCFSSTI